MARATGAAPRVAPDVVDLLERQHGEIRQAFRKAMVPGRGAAHRFAELRRLLAVHEAAEEAHVHPMLRKVAKNGRTVMQARLAEEAAAKKLLRGLERSTPGRPGYYLRLAGLQLAVLAHARREEREEFPLLRRAVSPARRRMLGAESLLTQKLAPTRPPPLVNHQLTNKLVAPLLGPLDRSRDVALRLTRKAS